MGKQTGATHTHAHTHTHKHDTHTHTHAHTHTYTLTFASFLSSEDANCNAWNEVRTAASTVSLSARSSSEAKPSALPLLRTAMSTNSRSDLSAFAAYLSTTPCLSVAKSSRIKFRSHVRLWHANCNALMSLWHAARTLSLLRRIPSPASSRARQLPDDTCG
jgi:hypothetical protein